MKRSCKKCGEDWVVDPTEAEFFRSKGTAVPRVCTSCRAKSRSFEDTTIDCAKCDASFEWPKELALLGTMFGWKQPHRCPGGCGGDTEQLKRFRGDMYVIGPVWLRMVKGIDIDAEPLPELTPEQQLRETKVPKLDELFKGLGSGMSGGPGFGDLPGRTPSLEEMAAKAKQEDDLPPENLPSPDSLFSNFKK